MTAQKMQIRHNIFHLKLLLSWNSTYVTKKCVWQVTTIIQLALCHLVTSHFQEIACNYTPKGQIRWPIFLLLLCMIVLTEITSKFPKPIIFRILVFSCHKMTLITIITRMPHIPNRRYHMLFKIWKILQSHFLCDILRYVFFTKYCRYHIYHMYWDRKRVVHQVKYMTFSRRCRMFF